MTAYRVEKSLGSRKTVLGIALLIPLGYLLLGQMQGLWTLSFLFIFYILRGIATPVLKDYIHRLTSSDIRATVLSVRNFIIRIMFVMVGPVMGMITDNMGLQIALTSAGIVFLVIGATLAFLFIRLKTKT